MNHIAAHLDVLDKMPQIHLVAPQQLSAWAPSVEPYLRKMAQESGGRFETGDLFAAIAQRSMVLWVILEGSDILGVGMSQVIVYPRLRAMRLIGMVGHRPRRWMHLLHIVERVSRENFGCSRMEALHQPGHERLLRTGGWRPWHILSEKPL
ncbi:MAG: hypothetical protein KGI63_13510 [Xanthomonadaceae bacterium]|nr:hypothetical protein [Xanthomonadaceae bacterium]